MQYHFTIDKKIEPMWDEHSSYQMDRQAQVCLIYNQATWSGWYLGDFEKAPSVELVGIENHPILQSPCRGTPIILTDGLILGEAAKWKFMQLLEVYTEISTPTLSELFIKEAIRLAKRDWVNQVTLASSAVLDSSKSPDMNFFGRRVEELLGGRCQPVFTGMPDDCQYFDLVRPKAVTYNGFSIE